VSVTRFEELLVWQKAKRLCVEVYRVTGAGPFMRDFGLRDQIQRAAVSVMSNIAEGFERNSRAEFARFLAIARGSAGEVRARSTWLVSWDTFATKIAVPYWRRAPR
jgi:four helix bundle protein